MGTTQNDKSTSHVPPTQSSTVILMALTIADTTWRIFVPSVGLTIVGLLLDRSLGTKPWLMIGAAVIGLAVAAVLVKVQIKKVRQ